MEAKTPGDLARISKVQVVMKSPFLWFVIGVVTASLIWLVIINQGGWRAIEAIFG